jgi:hypothetical protein
MSGKRRVSSHRPKVALVIASATAWGETAATPPAAGKRTKSRLRWPKDLPKPGTGDVPYAKRRPELLGLMEAEQARLLRDSEAWRTIVRPICEKLDEQRSTRALYTSEELELVLLFGQACGGLNAKDTRMLLAGDDPRPRQILGFDRPRNDPWTKKRMILRDGVPSEPTISRHKKRLTEEVREAMWAEVERAVKLEHLATPELQEECGVLYQDGTTMLTHYTCPVREGSDTGAYGREITCPTGGYRGRTNPVDKQGQGFTLVTITSETGVPLAHRVVPLNRSEVTTGLELIREDFARDVAPYLTGRVNVLVADGAFHSPELRAEARKVGIIESIHLCSHAEKSKSRAERMSKTRRAIEGYDNWFANDHREISCRCGKGVSKIVGVDKNGESVVRVQGKCEKCGVITVTSGDWRYTSDNRFVRCHPKDEARARDWAFGNPLTFNDLNAKEYGKDRFGRHEGFHGALSTRYKLIEHKRWTRTVSKARIEVSMTFALMHVIGMEQRRRVRLASSAAPPGTAAVA